jgi:hypothetical protein
MFGWLLYRLLFDDFTFARLAFVIFHLGIFCKLIIYSSSAFSLLLTHVQCNTCILLFTAIDWTIRQFDPQGIYGDSEGGGKLDTYFVVHEKVTGLFGLLCDAVEKNLSPWYYPILLLVVICLLHKVRSSWKLFIVLLSARENSTCCISLVQKHWMFAVKNVLTLVLHCQLYPMLPRYVLHLSYSSF